MYKQNYKSDFKFVMRRYRCVAGKEELTPVPWPEDIDWRLLLKTPHSAKSYEASCRGGVMRNCAKTEDGGILIVMDKHGLSPGELRYEFFFELPDPLMASGIADLYKPGSTGIMLTTDATCECGGLIDVAVLADMYRGEPFRYTDFTAEQLEDLRRPAKEAADEATEAVSALEKAVSDAEDLRVKAEDARDRAEQLRNRTESERISDEQGRVDAEDERKANETARISAEAKRASAESTRKSNESQRVSSESERASSEAQRLADEAERKAAETQRVANEKVRNSKEQERLAAEQQRVANEDIRIAAEKSREKSFEDAHSRAVAAIKAANEAIAAANKATQLANDAAELCATKIALFEAIGKEILSHQYLTLEN